MANKAPAKADVLQGTLDLMLLQTLATLGPLHGYSIAARLEQVSAGALQVNMGTLYPGLMRLEQRGHVPLRVERDRHQPEGALLQHHRSRAPATRHRKGG